MPHRVLIAKELADIFRVLSHPDRVRLIEELGLGECDVNTLHQKLDLPATRVSQHLSVLRAYRIVEERRDGRHHVYHLTQPALARWILDGMQFLETRVADGAQNRLAIEAARRLWARPAEKPQA